MEEVICFGRFWIISKKPVDKRKSYLVNMKLIPMKVGDYHIQPTT